MDRLIDKPPSNESIAIIMRDLARVASTRERAKWFADAAAFLDGKRMTDSGDTTNDDNE